MVSYRRPFQSTTRMVMSIVVGKKARHISKEDALDYVFGYSIGNDISQRVWQGNDRTMFRGKNCDTFKPFGPWIVTGLDPCPS